jgi:hypothetical protein
MQTSADVQPFTFRLGPIHHGWVAVEICAGEQHATFNASYTPTDALDDLLRAVLAVLTLDATPIWCHWSGEPGYRTWLMLRHQTSIEITMYESDTAPKSIMHSLPDATVFQGTCRTLRFINQVQSAVQGLLTAYGAQGYQQRWHHAFPSDAWRRFRETAQSYRQAHR